MLGRLGPHLPLSQDKPCKRTKHHIVLYVGARNKQLKQETPCDMGCDVGPSGFQMPFVTTPIRPPMVCVLCPQTVLPPWLSPLRRTREHVAAQPLLGPSVLGKLPPVAQVGMQTSAFFLLCVGPLL